VKFERFCISKETKAMVCNNSRLRMLSYMLAMTTSSILTPAIEAMETSKEPGWDVMERVVIPYSPRTPCTTGAYGNSNVQVL